MEILSERLKRFKPSLTVEISQKARELTKQGKDIISLSSGEPDFDTPNHIKAEGINAINKGYTKYTPVDGIISLKQAIVDKFKKDNGLLFKNNQVTVGVGGKHVIYNLFMSTLNKSDEVLIPSPYWVSYPDIVSLCGGKPVIIETKASDKFKITPDSLEKKITPNTKWLIINSPSNPTGMVYSKKELLDLSKILLEYKHIHILSDDIYEHILYDDQKFFNIVNVEPKLMKRTFIINGVSKAFSMTGWRIGFGAGDEKIIKAMSKIQSQSTTNPTSICQHAAVTALSAEKEFLNDWILQFSHRRNYVCNFLDGMDTLSYLKPEGAFYLFISCERLLNRMTPDKKKIIDDVDFSNFLLEFANIAVVPGIAFGSSPYFRISYAASMDLLKIACQRMKEAVSLLE